MRSNLCSMKIKWVAALKTECGSTIDRSTSPVVLHFHNPRGLVQAQRGVTAWPGLKHNNIYCKDDVGRRNNCFPQGYTSIDAYSEITNKTHTAWRHQTQCRYGYQTAGYADSAVLMIPTAPHHVFSDLRRIHDTINQHNAHTTATSLIHYKVYYCNSLLHNLPATQTNCLQLVLNCALPKLLNSSYNSHFWIYLLVKNKREITKFSLSLTYKALQTEHPFYLRSLPSLNLILLHAPLSHHLKTTSIILLLLCRIIFHLIYVDFRIISLLLLN